MSSLIVAKFGGTSMATGHSFRLVAERIRRNKDMRLIVVSAPGKINNLNDPSHVLSRDTAKVTDALLGIVAKSKSGQPLEKNIYELGNRYGAIEDELRIPDEKRVSQTVDRLIRSRLARCNHRNPDAPVAALGEELNARLLANYLHSIGICADYLDPIDAGILVSGYHGVQYVRPDHYETIASRVRAVLTGERRLVVPGFFGYDEYGDIKTFQRGGSDYTGSVLAAALHASLYQNFIDLDGIHAVEPSIDPNAPTVRGMTHRELTELTLGGAFGVFQYDAVVPLAVNGIPVQVLSTFEDDSVGTHIVSKVGSHNKQIAGIVHRGEFVAFEIVNFGIANEVGSFVGILDLFGKLEISIEHAPSSTNDISIIVRKSSLEKAGLTTDEIIRKITAEFSPFSISAHELSAVAIIGEGINKVPGFGRRVFTAVESEGVTIQYHSYAGISFILWLKNGDAAKALSSGQKSDDNICQHNADKVARAVYREFFSKN